MQFRDRFIARFNFYAGYASPRAAEGKGTISSPEKAPENKRAVIRPGRHRFGTLSCNLKAATNRASRSVSLKKIKISRRSTRVPRLKEVLCIISRSLRGKRVAWAKRKDKNIENPRAKDLITESNPSFSEWLSLLLFIYIS